MKKLILILFVIGNFGIYAQESGRALATEPLDLPNFIIRGDLQLDVNAGFKQDPSRPVPLTSGELDSLNSLDKMPIKPLNPPALPVDIGLMRPSDMFVKGQFGRYATAGITAGLGLKLSGYDLYAVGSYENSAGHVKNSEYSRLDFKLTSDYIAPEKFFIFGGSRTRTEVNFNSRDYLLYGSPEGLERTIRNFAVSVDVDGSFSGVNFNTGAGFNGFGLKTDDINSADNNYFGYLNLSRLWNNFYLDANLLLDMHSIRNSVTQLIQLDGSISVISDKVTLTGNAGLQMASNDRDISRGGLLIAGEIEYRLNELLTAKANVRTGLENNSFREMLYANPYLSHFAAFDYSYDILNAKGILNFHPTHRLGVNVGFNFRHVDRLPVWYNYRVFVPGAFEVEYTKATVITSELEFYWDMSVTDRFGGKVQAVKATLIDYENSLVPYYPELKISGNYYKKWSEIFGTKIGIDYFGERFADLENSAKISAFINVKAEVDYKVADGLMLFANFDNLINDDIVIFNGYKERGIFFSFGMMWQF